MVASHREDSARGGDRDTEKHGDHVEHHHELKPAADEHASVAACIRRCGKAEEWSSRIGANRVKAESVAGNLGIGHEKVEETDDDNRPDDRTGDVTLRVRCLLTKVRRRFESGEQKHAVHDSESDAGPPIGCGRRAERFPHLVVGAHLHDDMQCEQKYGRDSQEREDQLGASRQRHTEEHRRNDQSKQQNGPHLRGQRLEAKLGCKRVVDRAGDQYENACPEEEQAHVVQEAGCRADFGAQAVTDVVVQGAGGVNPLGVLRDDPGDGQHADRRDQHRERRGDAGAVSGDADDSHHQWHEEGHGKDRPHKAHRLRDGINKSELRPLLPTESHTCVACLSAFHLPTSRADCP
ncbi:unannotated protein [freshwater metagenome]|uniref:Unannotated protein n=1 Tax=freshwater metagenome TaxID=449393 RepID=A0A6J7QUT2_9ZZZZ